ncbi:MAG: PIG-L family deacetylase [Kiritimatiellae bacterium]|nr:PIG-L family deacetylase [Kiritimatiellia bacterium]MDD5522328.1 PIG-L family deacetylase [Kiritimatiellia bacterium]
MKNKTVGSMIFVSVTALLMFVLCNSPVYAAQGDLSTSPLASERASAVTSAEKGKLRIIAFGAHPDDCEIRAGGVAAMWAAKGHKVKFVSTTNGDVGHWKSAGGPLAVRRLAEVREAAKILGIETEVLDIHDGELMPTLENRRTITRMIREWKADIVLAHRSNDYHPDHRYTGILVQDAAFMVTVPFFCPDVPHLSANPIFLYFSDNFQKPNPFQPDIVVSLDSIIDKKLDALLTLESQFIEGCVSGHEGLIPKNEQERVVRFNTVRNSFRGRFESIASKYRSKLVEMYGEEAGGKVKCAEAFELCEYGRRPSITDLKKVFGITN